MRTLFSILAILAALAAPARAESDAASARSEPAPVLIRPPPPEAPPLVRPPAEPPLARAALEPPPALSPDPAPTPRKGSLDPALLAARASVYATDSKSPLAAAVLELVTPVPGAGQMYAHSEWWKVLVQYGLVIGVGLVGSSLAPGNPAGGFLGLGLLAGKTWAVTDAVLAAHRFNSDLKLQLGLVPQDWPEEESFR